MALRYTVKPGTYLLGSDTTTSNLTASYASNTVLVSSLNASQAEIYIQYTPAQNNRILYMQTEGGPDLDDLYKFVYTDLSTGNERSDFKIVEFPIDTSVTADTTYKIRLSDRIADQHYRLSFKEDGSSDFGTLRVRLSLYSL